MLGVDIESVWQQGSLITTPSPGPKKSKYTVPVENSQSNSTNASYQSRMQQQSHNPSDYYRPDFGPTKEEFSNNNRGNEIDFIPISQPQQPQQPQQPPSFISPPQYQVQNPEIPMLKEALTQQSNTVSDCQKELYYLKAIIHQLEKKLYEARNRSMATAANTNSSKQSWNGILWMLFIILILIIVLVILAQLSQKVNKLLKQPLMSYE
jgi:hypothetical protein